MEALGEPVPAAIDPKALALPGAVLGEQRAEDFRIIAAIAATRVGHDEPLHGFDVLQMSQLAVDVFEQRFDFSQFFAHECPPSFTWSATTR